MLWLLLLRPFVVVPLMPDWWTKRSLEHHWWCFEPVSFLETLLLLLLFASGDGSYVFHPTKPMYSFPIAHLH